MRVRYLGAAFLLGCGLKSAFAPSEPPTRTDPYAAPFVTEMKEAAAAGQAPMRVAIQSELTKATPHPFAPFFAGYTSCFTQPTAAPINQIMRLVSEGRNRAAIARYPSTQTSEKLDVWSLYWLGQAAMLEARPDIMARYATRLALLEPDFFGAPALFTQVARFPGGMTFAVQAARHPALQGSPTATYLNSILRKHRVDDLEVLAGIDRWLESHPHDALALASKGENLSAWYRWDEALDAYRQAYENFPFLLTLFPMDWIDSDFAALLLRKGDGDSAENVIRSSTALDVSCRRDPDFRLANVRASEGEVGQLRALERKPQYAKNPVFWATMADVADTEGHLADAVSYATRAWGLAPTNIRRAEMVLIALVTAKRTVEAEKLLTRLDASLEQWSPGIFEYALKTAAASNNAKLRKVLADRIGKEYPRSTRLQGLAARAYMEAGDREAAMRSLWAAMPVDDAMEFRELYAALKLTPEEVTALRETFGWHPSLWEPRDIRFPRGYLDERQANWRKAMALGAYAWPYDNAVHDYVQFGEWEKALALLDEAETHSASFSLGDRAKIKIARAYALLGKLRADGDHEAGAEALTLLDEYRSLGGSMYDYHATRAELLRRLGREAEALPHVIASLQINPDDMNAIWDLVTKYGVPEGWLFANRYLARNPNDPVPYRLLIQLHVMYGGSPILALVLSEKLASFAPERVNESHLGHAWGALGDARRSFDLQYADKPGIANSLRYVAWFEGARDSALDSEVEKVNFDPKLLEVRIQRGDGVDEIRRVHATSGKTTYFQRGTYWVRAEYERLGAYVTHVSDATGNEAWFSYDTEHELTSGRTNRPIAMRIEKRGAAKYLIVEGLGEMRLEENITSPSGKEIALLQTYAHLTSLGELALWEQRLVNTREDRPADGPVFMPAQFNARSAPPKAAVSTHQPVRRIVAAGDSIIAWKANELVRFPLGAPAKAESIASLNPSALAPDGTAGALVASNNTVYRVEAAGGAEKLFDVQDAGSISALLRDSHGAIWALTQTTLYLYADGALKAFGQRIDPEAFPARSDLLANVIETFDGHIWVIASDEGFRDVKGQAQGGGVLEYADGQFVRRDLTEIGNSWFITGYTKINDLTGIAGTTKGFIRHDANGLQALRNEPTYSNIHRPNRQSWLGTRGVRLAGDKWLFGTAGGLVEYADGKWRYPEELNRQLPDDAKFQGRYGVRSVYDLAADAKGNIYVGTSRGLHMIPAKNGGRK